MATNRRVRIQKVRAFRGLPRPCQECGRRIRFGDRACIAQDPRVWHLACFISCARHERRAA